MLTNPKRTLVIGFGLIFTVLLSLLSAEYVCAKPVTITFWFDHTSEDEVIFKSLLKAFAEQNPDIEVKWWNGQQTDYLGKLVPAFAGGIAPDVFYVRPGDDRKYLYQGFIYKIDPFVKRDAKELNVDDFIPPQLTELKDDSGKWWCLPYDYSDIALYYNKDAFDNAGLLPPTNSWTWNDVISAGVKLTRHNSSNKASFWGFDTNSLWGCFNKWSEGFVMSFGGRLFSDDYSKAQANTPGTAKALGIPAQMTLGARIAPLPGESNLGGFLAGKVGMICGGSWDTSAFRAVAESKFEFDVAMLPCGLPGKRVVSATGGAWAMSSQTKHPEAAWRLIKWLVTPEAQRALIVKPVRSLPPRQSLLREWAEQIVRAGMPRNAIIFGEQVVKWGRSAPPLGFQWAPVIAQYLVPLAGGQISPEEAALRIENQLNVEFDKFRKATRGK